ncbi:hypothetical protein SAMN05444417_1749 [Wenxinia saemankumensis]|uniref:Uncharacterized protein n=1 Tax=Wenxinia saemankumensis TaxID=1447782 RepID=A0A1M6E234_9RHOB|nr:hypothetical protein SAMN05444417_1749 [Wenxinia saemankumensis]
MTLAEKARRNRTIALGNRRDVQERPASAD